MPAVGRLGDITNSNGSHVVWPATSLKQCASTVYVNNLNCANVSSIYEVHCLGPVCHEPVQETGSGTVFVEGQPIARIGDETGCGHKLGTGSSNVFAGG